jgi:hypothetical protein
MADAKSEPKVKLVRAAVAPRHVVMVGPIPQKRKGPGELVDLPADEVARLMATGHLLDPGVPTPEAGPGPVFGQEGSMISSPAPG